MPGHGERFVETYEDWFTRINKRVQRLERRVARLASITEPLPTLIDTSGVSGSVYGAKTGGVVSVWSTTLTLTGGNLPVGTTVLAEGVVPEEFRPRDASGNRWGALYMSVGYAGVAMVSSTGGITVYNQTSSARAAFQFTITFIP